MLRGLDNVEHGLTDEVVDGRDPERALEADSNRETDFVAEAVGRTAIVEGSDEGGQAVGDDSDLVGPSLVVECGGVHLANM